MKKDVIYIDIEDDITAIINKVKDAKASIVALVPPKRIGILQSTVNLKLLQRAADTASRRVVLITNDQALTALAAGLSIPIAKNLQSKPEIASIPVLEADDEDIINGDELPVGELAAIAPLDDLTNATDTKAESKAATNPKTADSKGIKVPNFNSFRKKLFLFGGLGVVLISFLVWAIFFAPTATIAVTARTNVVNISKTLQLQANATLDTSQGILPVVTNQTKKTVSVDFTPTGKKDVGEKATGTVKFTTNTISALGTIAAGTTLSSTGGLTFTTDTAVTLTVMNARDGVTTTVSAAANGTKYNGVSGSVTGAPSGVTAAFVGSTAGGTDKTITIVSADDIAKAKEQLKAQDANTVKVELQKLFTTDQIVITEGFVVDAAEPVSTPGVDTEATTAKLTMETTYTLIGIQRSDLKAVYDAYLTTQLKGDSSQKIYESGDNATQFSQFLKTATGYSVRATAVAQVGPNINSSELAEQLKGKRVGEVQQTVGVIQGVKNVDVQLAPFWVNRVPTTTDRIKVTFTLENE